MWTGKLPDYEQISTSPVALQIYDAIIKRAYLRNFGMTPDQVDSTSSMLIRVWDRIDVIEEEKKKLSGNNNE